jgi:type II secretory pathway component GspD/PulD (secretin)
VIVEASQKAIIVRGPRKQVEAAFSLLENMMDAKPELALEVQEIEFDTDKALKYGLNLPTDFTVFNIPSEIRRVLGSDAQPIIDQINQTGTIDPSKINASDLANLQNSPLIQPFIFFGKGLGLTGITVSPVSGTLAASRSYSTNLEHLTLRTVDGQPALFRVGTKFPIVNSFFATVGVSNKGQALIGNTPQFNYVDLGLSLKTTPHYHSDGTIRLEFELEIAGLGTSTFNSIPDITTRSFKGDITVRDGEPSVVAGIITDQEQRATRGYPGLGQIPGVNAVLNTNSSDRPHQEVLIMITPHVVRKPFRDKGSSVVWNLSQ